MMRVQCRREKEEKYELERVSGGKTIAGVKEAKQGARTTETVRSYNEVKI